MNTKSVSDHKVQLPLGGAGLALIVVGAISYRGIVVSSESDRCVQHTHKVLVERHGGIVSVESQPRQGSTFRLTLEAGEKNL